MLSYQAWNRKSLLYKLISELSRVKHGIGLHWHCFPATTLCGTIMLFSLYAYLILSETLQFIARRHTQM
ncbi:hypothetical protein BDZ91DRAFT_743853 [Kalaharituber pfeilii]|nr:hypothetical protein BDZ91DRAFT_743853 [Kalaharituber pfeilii]